MKTTAYRGLDKLNLTFKKKVDLFLAEVNKTSKVIFVTETWRSEERQKELISL
jgi:antitoxin component of RelBE/YafQ-DinJ toxin-antitoxin module